MGLTGREQYRILGRSGFGTGHRWPVTLQYADLELAPMKLGLLATELDHLGERRIACVGHETDDALLTLHVLHASKLRVGSDNFSRQYRDGAESCGQTRG